MTHGECITICNTHSTQRWCALLTATPVPDQNRGGASPVDDGYHCPDEPQIELPASPVDSDVEGEQGQRYASNGRAQDQTALQSRCQAASPRGPDRIDVAL